MLRIEASPLRYVGWQGIHNHELGGNVSFMAEGTVDVAFKEATRATYTHHDCDNEDDACWADLYDVVTAEAGARP